MKKTSTQELVTLLEKNATDGYQVSRRHGILNRTYCVYLRLGSVYLYDVSEEFTFNIDDGLPQKDFTELYRHTTWYIECAIG